MYLLPFPKNSRKNSSQPITMQQLSNLRQKRVSCKMTWKEVFFAFSTIVMVLFTNYLLPLMFCSRAEESTAATKAARSWPWSGEAALQEKKYSESR